VESPDGDDGGSLRLPPSFVYLGHRVGAITQNQTLESAQDAQDLVQDAYDLGQLTQRVAAGEQAGDGARQTAQQTATQFRGSLVVALGVAFVAACPATYWLNRHGRGHAVVLRTTVTRVTAAR
jgi:hypothetical protein